MPQTRQDWARSYALQALSDLRAREAVLQAGLEKCHRLHFLQMAAEKTCKAYLTMTHGHESVRKTHACVKDHLPTIARVIYAREGSKASSWKLQEIRKLAREIEVIAPACNAGDQREDNSEYPWLDGSGHVQTPCSYAFPDLDDGKRGIVELIHLIRTAAAEYAK